MTVEDYLSPARFPLTTHPELTPEQQVIRDIKDYEVFEDARRNNAPMTDHERAVGAELTAKFAIRYVVFLALQSARESAAKAAESPPDEPYIRPGT